MLAALWIILTYPFYFFRPRHDLALEVLALRHQLIVLKRQTRRPRLRRSDRYLWLVNTFPYDTAPKYLLRDRDSIYGSLFVHRVNGMGIQQKLTAPRSPWQNPFPERLIGSIRRECLDRIIVLNEEQLRRMLTDYFDYYHRIRPHRSLSDNSPIPRPVESPYCGRVIEMPKAGGLHHRYLRQAA